MRLCLNMIVKNEAHIIEDTLNKLLSKVKIDNYIISDTGSTDNTVQLPLTNTGSIVYAIIDKQVASSSFCYYTSNPIGTTACDTCPTTKSIYFNANSITGSNNYANVTWYKDSNLSILADAGYYKLTSTPGISTPIYQVSAGPTQTRTTTGFCSDSTLTC